MRRKAKSPAATKRSSPGDGRVARATTARRTKRATAKPWSRDDVRTLRSLARKVPRNGIAKQLKRTPAAITFKAFQLRVSLRVKRSA
jgi:hypothetical protein